jgi:BirA family biotin operon repressor/biotin-[acetyl-CoA-carboxylase] ligase
VRFEHLDQIDSTNEEAKRRALAGEIGPLWIRADAQSAGRGRRGRAWVSADGNLFATGLYTLTASPAEAAQLSFAAALAVGDLAHAALPGVTVTLKWPNDVLVEGRKVAGILLESGARTGGGLWLAVGIGINLAHHPEDSERPTTDLAAHGAYLSPDVALRTLAERFEHWKSRWAEMGFAPLRDAWIARAHGMGGPCEARLDGETVRGVFADLTADGALRLDLPEGGRRFISAGDVFFPGQS